MRIVMSLMLCLQLHSSVDLIVFSYDRPLQLYALLESLETHVTNLGTICIIYRTSTPVFAQAYTAVAQQFPRAQFIPQQNPPHDFKPLVMQTIRELTTPYIMFAVDDIIVTNRINLHECIDILKKSGAYGFFTRLGKNITESYMINRKTPPPPTLREYTNCFTWKFREGLGDWGYPHTVDMTIYPKKTILDALHKLSFHSPNTLEGKWASIKPPVDAFGVCYTHSKIINIPLNLVQSDCSNRCMDSYTPKELLQIFNIGKKIDINVFCDIANCAPHMAYEPIFTNRKI